MLVDKFHEHHNKERRQRNIHAYERKKVEVDDDEKLKFQGMENATNKFNFSSLELNE